MEYIAVVIQPACACVFYVSASGKRTRLIQSSAEYCAAYADGYMRTDRVGNGVIREFHCQSGNAKILPWYDGETSVLP